jgi:hypothetical protein
MPEFLIAYNVVMCVLMIFLGAFQRRQMDRFYLAAIALAVLNGLGGIAFYRGTEFFPAAAFGLAFVLLIHATVVHFPLVECVEPLHACPAFRCRFVCNHETWVLVAISMGVVSLLQM